MRVLSLFDGIAAGRLALLRARINVDIYYSSEINAACNRVVERNFPDIVPLGHIEKIKTPPPVDLVIGGPPCQGFSSAGKGLNFNDPRSKLFFEFVRLLRDVRPRYWLMENVVMRKEWSDIISRELGTGPIEIDSALVSAQKRRRLYWTNIPVDLPADRGISFHKTIGGYPGGIRGRRVNPSTGKRDDSNMDIPIIQYVEPALTDKSNCLSTVAKDNIILSEQLSGRVPRAFVDYRYLTANEYEILQTFPVDYTAGETLSQRRKMLGNSWTVDVIAHIFKGLGTIGKNK